MAKFIMAEYKDNLLGEANSFLEVLEQVSRLAPLDKPVLVIGERGTGKELIANRLHFLFPLAGAVYLLNCAALNENLLDRNCSAMKPAPLPGPASVIRGALSAPTAVPCFSMSWRQRRCWYRKSCCA
jgi:hypothetical protein